MYGDRTRLRRVCCGVVLASAVAGFVAGCSDITPEPNDEGGGVLEFANARGKTRFTRRSNTGEHQRLAPRGDSGR